MNSNGISENLHPAPIPSLNPWKTGAATLLKSKDELNFKEDKNNVTLKVEGEHFIEREKNNVVHDRAKINSMNDKVKNGRKYNRNGGNDRRSNKSNYNQYNNHGHNRNYTHNHNPDFNYNQNNNYIYNQHNTSNNYQKNKSFKNKHYGDQNFETNLYFNVNTSTNTLPKNKDNSYKSYKESNNNSLKNNIQPFMSFNGPIYPSANQNNDQYYNKGNLRLPPQMNNPVMFNTQNSSLYARTEYYPVQIPTTPQFPILPRRYYGQQQVSADLRSRSSISSATSSLKSQPPSPEDLMIPMPIIGQSLPQFGIPILNRDDYEYNYKNNQFNQIEKQIRYYFSIENLCKDMYLRRQMDCNGFVSVRIIKGFGRIQTLSEGDSELVDLVIESIAELERINDVVDSKIRLRNGWENWILKKP